MESQVKIIITDDKPLFRKAIRRELEELPKFNIRIIAESANGLELLQQLEHLKPDVVLLDLEMPTMDGNTAMSYISKKYPGLKVIVVSLHSDQTLIEDYEMRGAKGYITKDEITGDIKLLAAIIKKVHLGGKYIARNSENPPLELTEIQKDIVHLKAKGKTKKEIGKELGMTPDGVGKQVRKIMAKMKIESLARFYNYLAKAGLEFLRKPN